MKSHDLKGLSLKGLEVFEALARTGSVADAAEITGLSAPAASQQLRNLDAALGVQLVDHTRRPMVLTPAGRTFLARVEMALNALRLGQRDLSSLDLSEISSLRLGVIEDFENEVLPELVPQLATTMRNCAFSLQSGASHDLAEQVARRDLDIAICAAVRETPERTLTYPLLNDPYILALPKGRSATGGFDELADLAFLRRDPNQVMGQQIEAYLDRHKITLPKKFELSSNQSISALVASGKGWTVTTPLSLLRAARFSNEIDAFPLPIGAMSRQIVLYATDDWTGDIPKQIAANFRDLIERHFTQSARHEMPWLGESFDVISEGTA